MIKRQFVLSFLLPYTVLLVVMVILLCCYPQEELHIKLNGCHTLSLDAFLRLYTVLAEWPLYVLALIPVFWKKWRTLTLVYAVAEGCGAIIVQILKHTLCRPRPAAVFANHLDQLNLVPGVELHHSNSFPSGHSSTFFIFFTCCAIYLIIYNSRKAHRLFGTFVCTALPLLLLFMAALGGYSRIYLSQHFMLDVCAGSFCGVVIATSVCYYFRDRLKKSLFSLEQQN